MIVVPIVLLCFLACGIILIVLGREAAVKKHQATYVDQEKFEFVYTGGGPRGGTLDRVLVNSKGLRYLESSEKEQIEYPYPVTYWEQETTPTAGQPIKWIRVEKTIDVRFAIIPRDAAFGVNPELKNREKTLSGYLRRKWGWFYVGITYPLVHILEFKIERARLAEGGESKREHVRNLVEKSTSEEKPAFIKAFLIRFPRPIVATDVEFHDKYTADIAVNIKCKVVIPLRTIPTWGDKFFEQLELTVIGAIGDLCRQMSYGTFIESFPIGPSGEFYQRVLSKLNLTLISSLGVEIEDGYVIDRELSGDSEQQQAALQAQKTAELTAKAAIATAQGQGDAEIELKTRQGEAELAKARKMKEAAREMGTGDALAWEVQIEALVKAGIQPADAARLIAQKMRMQAIEKTQLGTLVEGGGNAGVMIQGSSGSGGTPP